MKERFLDEFGILLERCYTGFPDFLLFEIYSLASFECNTAFRKNG